MSSTVRRYHVLCDSLAENFRAVDKKASERKRKPYAKRGSYLSPSAQPLCRRAAAFAFLAHGGLDYPRKPGDLARPYDRSQRANRSGNADDAPRLLDGSLVYLSEVRGNSALPEAAP